MGKLRIAFLSNYSPEDRKASSGTNYKMAEELSKIGDLEWVPIKVTGLGNLLFKVVRRYNKIFKKKINISSTKLGSKLIYKSIPENTFDGFDLVVAFFCMPVLAQVKTDKPVVYFTDATYPAMVDYYPEFSNLFSFNRRQGISMEKDAMDKASAVVVSSQWAKDSAIKDLGQNPKKINIVEFGANIDDKDIRKDIPEIDTPLQLLFLGVNWQRKGGEIAVAATKWLNDNGVSAVLNIVGIKELDKDIEELPYVKNHGFLNKNIKEQYEALNNVINQANILLLPTKAECSAIAFSEASANGLPIFTHNTGGVSNYVNDGINGYMLPLGSTGEDFGKKIKEALQSGEIVAMSHSAKHIYKDRLNWAVWGEKVREVIRRIKK